MQLFHVKTMHTGSGVNYPHWHVPFAGKKTTTMSPSAEKEKKVILGPSNLGEAHGT